MIFFLLIFTFLVMYSHHLLVFVAGTNMVCSSNLTPSVQISPFSESMYGSFPNYCFTFYSPAAAVRKISVVDITSVFNSLVPFCYDLLRCSQNFFLPVHFYSTYSNYPQQSLPIKHCKHIPKSQIYISLKLFFSHLMIFFSDSLGKGIRHSL